MKKYLLFLMLFCWLTCLPQETANDWMQKGVSAYSKSNYSEAVTAFGQCIELSKKIGDKQLLSKAYNNLGNSLSQMGRSDEALKKYLLSLKVSQQIKDGLNVAKTSKNIGALYSEQKDFASAMHYYNRSLAFAREVGDKSLIADCLNNMGVVYEQHEKYNRALESYNEALAIYRRLNDESHIAMTLNNLAIVYKYLKDYKKSISYYEEALGYSNALGDQFMVSATLNNLGNVYALTGDYDRSLELCQQAYHDAMAIHANEVAIEACDGIANAYERLEQYPYAIWYRKQYDQKKDSFINVQRSAQLAEMQVQYETRQKTDSISLLSNEKRIQQLEITEKDYKIKSRNRLIVSMMLFFAGLGIAGYFWRERQLLKERLQKDLLVRQTEEQERVRLAKDIHDDLGSGLTKINFLSEIILEKTSNLPAVKTNTQAVQETAKKMVENMRDLIWALNPENTTLANLVARMREFASDYFEDQDITLNLYIPDNLPQDGITKESHRELLMVVKESLNNIVKHAKAAKVCFTIALSANDFTLTIRDNGKGFNIGNSQGNGLKNMESRISSIGGTVTIDSQPDMGTTVKAVVPLKKMLK